MNSPTRAQELEIPFEKHVLENGLQVVIHEDHSDPVVAVYVVYHVGSGREEPGRSGFAHLFEHLMFQGSEHVGDDQHFKIVSEAGGTLNGTTNRDRTNYFETLPSNHLETALWLEADRMGFLLPAITQRKLDNQREVVKNERRQNYENQPYAKAYEVSAAALYPSDHPYHWLTIGSHADLEAASLADVHAFFRRWYGPNNATLAIGGDVNPTVALELARKYFGGLPRGPEVQRPEPRATDFAQTRRVAVEDKIKLPQLSLTWPTVPRGHEDEASLLMLAAILSANKSAILDRALTIDEVLATRVSAGQDRGEMAGEFDITVRAAPGVTLDTLETKIHALLAQLEEQGVNEDQLRRQQTRYESSFVNRLETVSARTSALAEANVFEGDPAEATRLLREVLEVSPRDVERALEKYLLGQPFLALSVVPEGQLQSAATGRTTPQVAIESTVQRDAQPRVGPAPNFKAPAIWHDALPNGVQMTGTRYTELPLVSVQLSVPAGHLRTELRQAGLATLTAELMNEGTESLDTLAFADRLDELGANFNVSADDEELTISLRTLRKHLPEALALLQDVVLKPRFSPADFERLKQQRLTGLSTRGDSIGTISRNAWARVAYGADHPEGWPTDGTLETVGTLTLSDVRAFHRRCVVPSGARLLVVGDVQASELRDLLARLGSDWAGEALPPLAVAPPRGLNEPRVFLVDKPEAAQSEVRIGHIGLASTDPDWYPAQVMNYSLGGAFSSRINMNLREDKGYTYGARSNFSGGLRPGLFTASAGVHTQHTAAAISEFLKELRAVKEGGLSEEEVAFARDALLQAMNRQFESISALSGILDSVSFYGYPDDYLQRRIAQLNTLGKADLDKLAREHVHPEQVAILVVGDAAKVRESLAELGFGPPVELDIDGNPLTLPEP
ncbi:MAG: M16 family metallopeptidase [Planctomycetota bacterium]